MRLNGNFTLDLFDAKTGKKIHSFKSSSNPVTSYCPSGVISKEELQKMVPIENTIFSDMKDVTPDEEKENI